MRFVDLMVLLAVIGTAMVVLLPGLAVSREFSRQCQCQENLRRIGRAMAEHHDKNQHLPTGGWGHRWMGDPDRGTGKHQPGGWIYNILPYVGQEALHQLGAGLDEAGKRRANAQRAQISLRLFNCPSRRQHQLYPCVTKHGGFVNADPIKEASRSDYAACAGDELTQKVFSVGPPSYAAGDDPEYSWPTADCCNGIGGPRSTISFQDVTDGLSNTYMVGEKYLDRHQYKTGHDMGDNQNMYVGFANDIYRVAHHGMLRNQPGLARMHGFGSPHPYGCQFVFCDGSVRNISNAIDPQVHRSLADRRDGQVVNLDEYSHLIE